MDKKIKTFNFWKYKKTISNIEQAKSNPKNSVIIKKNKTFHKKSHINQIIYRTNLIWPQIKLQ